MEDKDLLFINYCIFEKKECKYAINKNGCFSCEAKSDEEMTCYKDKLKRG